VALGADYKDVEIIDLASTETTCESLPNFPYSNMESVGDIGFDNEPIICGGAKNGKACHIYSDGQWKVGPSLIGGRFIAAMIKTDHGLIISGGRDYQTTVFLSSQEILTSSGWESTTSLPKPVMGHCLVNLNSTHMSIGGHDGTYLDDVNILNLNTEQWTTGPNLNTPRFDHSCAKILAEDGKEIILVIGGYAPEHLDSVEVLMPGDTQWVEGPPLPKPIYDAQLVQDAAGGVVLIGGFSIDAALDTLYKLSSLDEGWQLMDQKLNTPRWEHTAFLIDDELTTCTKKK